MEFDKENFDKVLQEIIREIIPTLKNVSFSNEFIESIFDQKKGGLEIKKGEKR